MFSSSGAHRTPHIIELTRECKPSKPFSMPDNLPKKEIIKNCKLYLRNTSTCFVFVKLTGVN